MKILINDLVMFDLLFTKLKNYFVNDEIVEHSDSFEKYQFIISRLTNLKKNKGSILINYIDSCDSDIDAIITCFINNANAVLYKIEGKYKFVDALGNLWFEGDIQDITEVIHNFYIWNSGVKRINSIEVSDSVELENTKELEKFIELNKVVANEFEKVRGRYFGNCSTRCSYMFPSMNLNNFFILVSKRNTPKSNLTINDLVVITKGQDDIFYYGQNKPSVDAPIQYEVYKNKPEIKFMIHGHTYIDGVTVTDNYYPCGDMREVNEILNKIQKNNGVLNLKNHGFLIYSDTIENLERLINNSVFVERKVGFETI